MNLFSEPALVLAPDTRLRTPTQEVSRFDEQLRQREKTMLHVMRAEGGIGLAAPQVGWLSRMVVMDRSAGRGAPHWMALFNPVLVGHAGEQLNEEGCLSLPGQRVRVLRPAQVHIQYQDVDGQPCFQEFQGLAAACILHEMDHLEGRLMTDRNAWGLALPAHQKLNI